MTMAAGLALHIRASLCESVAPCENPRLGSIKIVNLARFDNPVRGALRRNVALRRAEKFVADHEFLNRRGAQQRREIMGVEVALFVSAAVGRFLVKSHGIGEGGLEQIVI